MVIKNIVTTQFGNSGIEQNAAGIVEHGLSVNEICMCNWGRFSFDEEIRFEFSEIFSSEWNRIFMNSRNNEIFGNFLLGISVFSWNFWNFRLNGSLLGNSTISRFSGNVY